MLYMLRKASLNEPKSIATLPWFVSLSTARPKTALVKSNTTFERVPL
jgi:hypothetical protein